MPTALAILACKRQLLLAMMVRKFGSRGNGTSCLFVQPLFANTVFLPRKRKKRNKREKRKKRSKPRKSDPVVEAPMTLPLLGQAVQLSLP